jgi:MFS family permease
MLTDMASEMLYPIMPVYLQSIGFSILFIGILEGLADAIAGLSKGYFGHWSDRIGRRLPFVQLGYGLSAISKPLLGLFTAPLWVFGARTLDRFGKGMRTAARDAMLSDETIHANKGRVFGFHRALDTLGAILGPLLALLWLSFHPQEYRTLFFVAFIPGLASIVLTLAIKERPISTAKQPRQGLLVLLQYYKRAGFPYRRVSMLLVLFAIFNSSDVFLLLRAKSMGFDDSSVIWFYILYNLVFALLAFPMGKLADKFGMRPVLIAGIMVFGLVYLGFATVTGKEAFVFLFILYGAFAASTEGLAKAWISNLCRKEDTATAIGSFLAFQSLAMLAASMLTGFLWWQFGPVTALTTSAAGALLVAFLLYRSPVKSS